MTSLSGLRRLSRPEPGPAAAAPGAGRDHAEGAPLERCELCSTEIAATHSHVADLQGQRLLCSCRPCYLLFTDEGAGAGRFRALPDASRRVVGAAISAGQWDALQIPVDVAFLFRQGDVRPWTACYPGPGGATESLLDLASWDDVLAENPVLGSAAPDVEAVLLRRDGGTVEAWLVPIDTCYSLVGLVRRDWVGFSGGEQVWAGIAAFFRGLDARSGSVDRHGRRAADG
ncbi:MAG: DUF5947 family protein [Kineosporiaceae bacterium]